jgi:hypothetical protein
MPEITVSIEGVQKLLQKQGSPSGVGISDVSSFVNTNWYCRFTISALSLASACNIPATQMG